LKKIYLLLIFIIVAFVTIAILIASSAKNGNMTKIKLAEVAHTVFYAPQYVAISEGYFKDEGLDIEVILTPGADKVMAALLSGDVQIGLAGSEATIYVYNGGEKNYIKSFAGLTKRDGSFIVSRNHVEDFTIESFKNNYVIGGRKGGMPEMTFEWILRENDVATNELTIDTGIAFAAMGGAFIGGIGDYVLLFEPTATEIERMGFGYVVESLGKLGGEVPYTSYSARKNYIEENPETLEKFSRAINKGLEYVKENDANAIALSIRDFFPDTSLSDLIKIVERYQSVDVWKADITINDGEWKHLQDIMENANELEKRVEFKTLVETKFMN